MEFNLKFDENMLSAIGKGLEELPFKIAAPVVSEINKQIDEQQQAMKKAAQALTPEPVVVTDEPPVTV